MSKKGDEILRKHLPKIEKHVKELGVKKMTPEIAEQTRAKADKILAMNFKGKKLEKMRKQLQATIKDLSE